MYCIAYTIRAWVRGYHMYYFDVGFHKTQKNYCHMFLVTAPTIDPCATIRCSVGYQCMVDNITGTSWLL